MTPVKLVCEKISEILSMKMYCKVGVYPTETVDMVWDGKTVWVIVIEEAKEYASANDRMRGTGNKKLCQLDDVPFDITTSQGLHEIASHIRGLINQKMGV